MARGLYDQMKAGSVVDRKLQIRYLDGRLAFETNLSAYWFDGKSHGKRLGAAVCKALNAGVNLRGSDLTGVDLTDMWLSHKDLSGADLTDADLTDARLQCMDLADANLTRACLTRTDLRGSDLRGAKLISAKLVWTKLRDVRLADTDMTDLEVCSHLVPVVPHIDAQILRVVEDIPETTNVEMWSERSSTRHFRAGYAIMLAGSPGADLKTEFGLIGAGALIYAASRPGMPVPDFYAETVDAIADIRACALRDPVPGEPSIHGVWHS